MTDIRSNLIACWRLLLAAMSDSEAFERGLILTLYGVALERLLDHESQYRNGRRALQERISLNLIESALRDQLRAQDDHLQLPKTFNALDSSTQRVLRFIRNARNGFLHTEPADDAFSRQIQEQVKVSPNLIAFRALSSLILLRMVDVLEEPLPHELAGYVLAVEHWLGELQSLFTQEPEVAIGRFGLLHSRYSFIRRSGVNLSRTID